MMRTEEPNYLLKNRSLFSTRASRRYERTLQRTSKRLKSVTNRM